MDRLRCWGESGPRTFARGDIHRGQPVVLSEAIAAIHREHFFRAK